jgi:flavin reductase (DIM6/NTAB) family NADH-FMN oxidoreductase RutF
MPAPYPDTLLSNFWSPLCAIGSHGSIGPNAQICVSVFGASIVPDRPRLLVVLSKTNYTTGLVAEAGTLAITLLPESQLGLLEPLGLRSGRDGPKLAGLAYSLTADGDPFFHGGTGYLRGQVLESFDNGDSTSFLVAVREREMLSDEPPLAWAAAQKLVSPEILQRWREKSAHEQALARAQMLWREPPQA